MLRALFLLTYHACLRVGEAVHSNQTSTHTHHWPPHRNTQQLSDNIHIIQAQRYWNSNFSTTTTSWHNVLSCSCTSTISPCKRTAARTNLCWCRKNPNHQGQVCSLPKTLLTTGWAITKQLHHTLPSHWSCHPISYGRRFSLSTDDSVRSSKVWLTLKLPPQLKRDAVAYRLECRTYLLAQCETVESRKALYGRGVSLFLCRQQLGGHHCCNSQGRWYNWPRLI